ncbi:MAG: GAF domain-containing protein, partial [Phycisphaerae bacterium]|nr:GAF domain-containing protein [Phycisphaerae bacterium]
MTVTREHADRPAAEQQSAPTSPAEALQRLAAFDGPPEAFLGNLLNVQCALVAARGAALMRPTEGGIEPVAVYPPMKEGQTAPSWLAQMVETAEGVLQSGQTAVRPLHGGEELYGEGAARHLILLPLRTGQGPIGVSGFYLEGAGDRLDRVAERLELTSGLLHTYTLRQRLQRREIDLQLLRQSVESLAVVNQHARFTAAAMAMCNQLCSEWQAQRASIGFLQGRNVKLKAMSHTEKFTRNMQLVQAVEAAMEECLDQDLEIVYPAGNEATYVCRAAKTLGTQHGPSAVVSLPLRQNGEPVAVLTLERPPEKPLTAEDVETLRLTADLCTPRLVELQKRDRWFGARMASSMRDGAAVVIGPKHTWVKLIVILLTGLLAFLVFAKGTHTVEAQFAIEPAQQYQVSAPQDGTLMEVYVDVGDEVSEGDLLPRSEEH